METCRAPHRRVRGLALAISSLFLLACHAARDTAPPAGVMPADLAPPPPIGEHIRFTFTDATPGSPGAEPVFAVITGRDRAGRFCRVDRSGQLLPCSAADNVLPRGGREWCDYSIPLQAAPYLDLDRTQALDSGRVYLSVGEPLWLRVDETSGGLVQPDPANASDPNQSIRYDWIELTLDGSGFHGNTTCVDQFGLPIALSVAGRGDPDHPQGPVGLDEARSALFQAYRAEVPPAFQVLAQAGDARILAPAHGFDAAGAGRDYLKPYIGAMWERYRAEPLVLSPDEGTFTGRVDAGDRLVFTRDGDPAPYIIARRPTTQEAFLGNGVLAQGSGTEKVLGAQLAALINRHLLEAPGSWRDASAYYLLDPCNQYARFWHRHGLGGRAYGFAYDDVNDQSSSLSVPDPLEIHISYRLD